MFAVCALALFYPIIGGSFLVNPQSDQLSGHAYRVFGGAVFDRTGGFAQWNPLILGGLPFIAGQHGDIFYPTFVLRQLLGADQALNWSFAIHLWLCGLFAFGFLRAWGIAYLPSIVGGVGYMLSGTVASLVSPGHDGKMYVSALAPLVLWMLVRGVRDGRVWAWGVLALATGLCIFSPHFQMTYYLATLAVAFTLYLAFQRTDKPLASKARWMRLAFALGAALLGAAIGAVHFLPLVEYIPFSPRAGEGRGWDWSTGYSMPPEELINAYLPQFSGILERYWGRNFFKLHSDYLGAALLVLAGASFGARRRRGFVAFWMGAAIVSLLWAFGGHTPFYRLVYHGLPMMKAVRAPGMIFFITSLAVAVLAAIGTERLLTDRVSKRYLLSWGVVSTLVALVATAGFFQGLGQFFVSPERFDQLFANGGAVILGAWRSMLFVGLVIIVLFSMSSRQLTPTKAGWSLIAIVAVDAWWIDRAYFRFMPPAHELYGTDPVIEYLKSAVEPGRVIVLPSDYLRFYGIPSEGGYEIPGDPILNGDALMIHGVRTLTGHQANEPQSWVELAGNKSPAPPSMITSRQFRRLTNAKYWLTDTELPALLPHFDNLALTKRIGPVRNVRGNTVYLYELMENNPAAWVVPAAVWAPRPEILSTVLDPRFDASRIAIFDSTASVAAASALPALPQALPVTVSIVRFDDPRKLKLTLSEPSPAGAVVVLSENYYPGWRASVGGQNVPINRVDYSFIGLSVPQGTEVLDLTFTDQAYERAKPITVIALLVATLLIAGGVSMRHRAFPG